MTLVDLRKLSIRKQSQIRFRLQNGMECVITDRGIAHVPDLKGIPDFSLEEQLASATEFTLEPALLDKKNPVKPRPLSRDELVKMTTASPSAAHAADHDDE